MAKEAKELVPTPPVVPVYMVVNLHEITQKYYEEMFATPYKTAERLFGFVLERDGTRWIFIYDDDRIKYYQGTMGPGYTTQMFLDRETKGVEISISITFTEPVKTKELEEADA